MLGGTLQELGEYHDHDFEWVEDLWEYLQILWNAYQ
jgi:hypothetical protein